MIAPSSNGVALLTINAIFTTLAIASYVARFIKNLSKAKSGLLPWRHFLITDAYVFTATVILAVAPFEDPSLNHS